MNVERCILMADDEPNDMFLLRRAFQDAKIDNPLMSVQDGQEVVDYLTGEGNFSDRERFPLPSLLILDLKMPRKSGMDVLKWIRGTEGFRCLPIIVFSSSAHPADVENAYELGANAFVVKPTGIDQRTEFVRMVKSFWLGLIEPPPVGAPVRRTKHK